MKKGKFIVFEGIDGAGKTTQAALLKQWLRQKGLKCITTKEPTENITGNLLKVTLYLEKLSPITDALLFAADRAEHLDKEIKKALKAGNIVISERYMYANLAYQSAQGVDENFIEKINEFVIKPDLVILLDVPADIALKRKWNVLYYLPSKFEKSIEFNEKVRKNYLRLAKKFKMKVIDATKSQDEVFEEVKTIVTKALL
jgi:dTMP kinase